MSLEHRWTDETDTEARAFFDTLTDAEIRRRQDLCNQQKQIAYRERNIYAMADLERMGDALTAAMFRRL